MRQPIQVFSYSIQNLANDSVDIHIDGDIVDASTQAIFKAWFGDDSSTSFKSFRDEVNKLDAAIYNVYINSPGGHVGDALAIYDFLRNLQDKKGRTVNTYGVGIVASAAVLPLLASNNPKMSPNSLLMIHNVSGGAWGTVNEVEAQARTMRKFNDMIVNLITSKSKKTKEDIQSAMDAETWMSASEAEGFGLAIVDQQVEEPILNAIPQENWPYANKAILNTYNKHFVRDNNEDMKKFWNNLATKIQDAINGTKPTAATTNEQLVNQIAAAVSGVFKDETVTNEFEAAVKELIPSEKPAAEEKPAATTNKQETKPVTAATKKEKTVEERLAALEAENEQLTNELASALGSKSRPTKNEVPATPIGSFD